jgi:hypothetical protein
MTRNQIHRMGHGGSEERLVVSIADWLVNILVTAGWKGSLQNIRQTVMARFSSRLNIAAKMAIRLNKAIGEEITSSDLEIIYIENDVAFDPTRMDNAYAEGTTAKEKVMAAENILCTSELGLRRMVKEKEAKSTESSRNEIVLLKPKVVLLSELEEATNHSVRDH